MTTGQMFAYPILAWVGVVAFVWAWQDASRHRRRWHPARTRWPDPKPHSRRDGYRQLRDTTSYRDMMRR